MNSTNIMSPLRKNKIKLPQLQHLCMQNMLMHSAEIYLIVNGNKIFC